ncbi:MAG: DUF2628 domain-containing protein [Prevotella sp.]|nr:DUF2628 domain-containing protein [Prevotella sp.]
MQSDIDQVSQLDDIIEDRVYYTTFFGDSADYYQERYDRFLRGEKFIFNFYAFLFGVSWLAYRKLYPEAIILFSATLIVDVILLLFFDLFNNSLLSNFTMLLWAGIAGYLANYIYLRKAQRTVIQAKEVYTNTGEQQDYLEREGGTSYIGLIVIGFFYLMFIVGLFFFYDYIRDFFTGNN